MDANKRLDHAGEPKVRVRNRLGLIVGTRPEFIKASALLRAVRERPTLQIDLVHSGQHLDPMLSDNLIAELALPEPVMRLDARGGAPTPRLPAMLTAMQRAFADVEWRAIVTIGDTSTVLAASLAASQAGLEHIRIEAGPRAGNRREPEEANRIIADHLGDLLLAPTPHALKNLQHEGLAARAHWTGDLTRDAFLAAPKTAPPWVTPYALATLHRPDNVDDPARLAQLADALALAPLPVYWPAHPRAARHLRSKKNLRIVAPLPFHDMTGAISNAAMVITDSGGVTREAAFAGKQVCVIATRAVWPELIDLHYARLCDIGSLLQPETWVLDPGRQGDLGAFGDGDAGVRICQSIEEWIRQVS